MHKKDFKRLVPKKKTTKKTLKISTKPSRSGRPEGRPAETGIKLGNTTLSREDRSK